MGKSAPFSLQRLKEIARRQDPPNWGPRYEPAIRAVREEAPSKSRFSTVWSHILDRYCHALSTPEQDALLIALHHPHLFELQEQRVLHPGPRSHPLAGHPTAVGMNLRPLAGTVQVCERLDMVGRHPCTWVNSEDGLKRLPVPIPYIGDLLLFLQDEEGPYCVNWTVKKTEEDFESRPSRSRPPRDPLAEKDAERSRHAIEEQYYADAGIPTIRITQNRMPKEFVRNLLRLFLWRHRYPEIPGFAYKRLCDQLQACTITGQAPLEIILTAVHRHNLPLEHVRSAFAKALLLGDVQVEMMQRPILIDQPLHRRARDHWQVLAPWFARPSA